MDTTEAPMTADEIIVRLSHLARTAKSESLQLRALTMLMRYHGLLGRPAAPTAAKAADLLARTTTPVTKAATAQTARWTPPGGAR